MSEQQEKQGYSSDRLLAWMREQSTGGVATFTDGSPRKVWERAAAELDMPRRTAENAATTLMQTGEMVVTVTVTVTVVGEDVEHEVEATQQRAYAEAHRVRLRAHRALLDNALGGVS